MTNNGAKRFANWAELIRIIEKNDGVITCSMADLRDIDGYGRLGGTVRANITRRLTGLGVSPLQGELPTDASRDVVLYRQGTPASELMDYVLTFTDGGGDPEATADSLRRVNQIPDPTRVSTDLKKARDIINALTSSLDRSAY